jgi:hypothetical protein
MNDVMRILKDYSAEITKQDFTDNFQVSFFIRKRDYEKLVAKISIINSVKIDLLDVE